MTDHYATLGVARTATQDEIKRAFRKLASQHHPDKGGDTAKRGKSSSSGSSSGEYDDEDDQEDEEDQDDEWEYYYY